MSHTPGPWETISSPVLTDTHPTRPWRTYVSSKNGSVAASNGGTIEEAEANGVLIATAPDLLAALEAAYDSLCDMRDRAPDLGITLGDDDLKAIAQARAAIAKARGEA